MSNVLPAGTPAPDFTLPVTPDQKISLQELRGQPVILAFYPADWSPVCGDQMALYNEILPEFQKFGAQLMGVSVDGVWCHRAFAEARQLHFPLLSDFEPKGTVARSYGAYRTADGVSERALFVIDRFWEMHDLLFENQERLSEPLFLGLAEELGLPPETLRQALEEGTYKARVRADFSGGVRSGVNGTPTFFISGERHDGPFDYETLLLAIQEKIGKQGNAVIA